MDVSTFNMKNKVRFSAFKKHLINRSTHNSKSGSVKGLSLAVAVMLGGLPSSLLHADDLANLIRQKSQNSSYSSSSMGSYNSTPNFGLPGTTSFYQNYASAPNIKAEHIDTLYRAEQNSMGASQQVLRTVRQMALDNKEIIKGSCWDYLNAAFNRAGVRKDTIFKGEYPYGPFIDTNEIRPGDWLYYINHSYNDVEHSGLFVGWLNRESNEALILSYAGESRNEPARYKVYDVSHTYNVMRPSL